MHENPPPSSHAAIWSLGVVGALVVYILSSGPALYLDYKFNPGAASPQWLEYFYAPVTWLHESTPLKRPLQVYWDWWENLAKPP